MRYETCWPRPTVSLFDRLFAPGKGAASALIIFCVALMLQGCGDGDEQEETLCGNDVRQGDQVCDGEDLAGQTCESLGFDGGALGCEADCSDFDTTECYMDEEVVCGNDVRQGDQVCDGEDMAGETCESLGFVSGELSCRADCSDFDTSGCDGCGNGRVDPGETWENCCVDVGCPFGVCDPDAMECVDPWLLECPEGSAGSCAGEQPWYCPEDGSLPEYDCGQCGCPGQKVCHEGFCYEQEVLDGDRSEQFPPMHLELERYFELYEHLMNAPAATLPELSSRIDALLLEDRRRTALLIGESHNSFDEQAVGVQLMRDLLDGGWEIPSVGIESTTLPHSLVEDLGLAPFEIDGDLTNDAYCDEIAARAKDVLNDTGGVYVQYSGSGHTSREVAYHEANWIISEVPHAAECLFRESRKAVTVIVFDPNVWMFSSDQSLTWRLGNYYPDGAAVSSELDASIDRWWQMMDQQERREPFDTVANGSEVNVRVVEAQTPDVFFAYLPRPDRPAYFLQSFRELWNEEPARDFLLANDMQPMNCSMSWNLTPGEEEIGFFCNKDGEWLNATVDATSFVLIEWNSS